MATPAQTTSLWHSEEGMSSLGTLQEDTRADVCVVGGGIAGLTTAYLLGREGRNVVVLEAARLGDGETGRTTTHLSSALDDRFTRLEKMFGAEGARLAAESHAAAIDRIEAIAAEAKIDCEFERLDGYLFPGRGNDENDTQREFEAACRAGCAGIEMLPGAPLPFSTGPTLRFPRQGQFHPLKYLRGLATAIRRQGGRIFVRSPVVEFEGGPPARAVTRSGPVVHANSLVVATNTPVNDRVTLHTRQTAYRSYVLAFQVPPNAVPRALYWDMEEPYHYVRVQKLPDGGEALIVGGEDHKTGRDDDPRQRFERLEQWTRERFPMVRHVVSHWSGQILEPVDSLAYLGRNPGDTENVYIATGDSGHGMTHGTIAGMVLTDLILDRANPWSELYDPARSVKDKTRFLREGATVAVQYLSWLSVGEVSSAAELKPGEGALIRQGLTKHAAYCDESGELHQLSAVCPHLGCIVNWNSAEKTWDCPCHGSRFDVAGKVLNGPALGNLERIEEEAVR